MTGTASDGANVHAAFRLCGIVISVAFMIAPRELVDNNRCVFSPSRPPFSPLIRPAGRLCVLALGLTLAFSAGSARAQSTGAGRVRMDQSFRAVNPAGATATATQANIVRDTLTVAEAGAPMSIRLMLRMRNAAELERRVEAGEIISREEMAARFLPEATDHQAVSAWLTSQGLTVTPAGAAHAAVMARGTPAQLEKAFETHFARVQYLGEEHTSVTVAPSLPAEIQARVSSVHGLQPHLHPHNFLKPANDLLYGQYPHYVNEITHAYNVTSTGLTGAGQTIGIIIDIPPIKGDLRSFYTNNALSQTVDNFSVVDVENVGTFDYSLTDPKNPPAIEATLDAEWSSGIAVGAKLVVYAANSLNNVDDAYSRVLDDLQTNAQPGLHQISMSYGAGERDLQTTVNVVPDEVTAEHNLFAAIRAYGVSLFASSGDSGAYGNDLFGTVQVNYPASDPLITGVGGTSLFLSSAATVNTQSIQAEYGWSFDTGSGGASGGGYSVFFPLPVYQSGVELTNLFGGGTGMRQVPDIAFVADPSTAAYLYFRAAPTAVGGTSWSSPCWAGMCALINQARADQGVPPLTKLNSRLYPLQGTGALRDIGGDGNKSSNGLYNTTTGYDLVTGLGVPNFAALAKQLLTNPKYPAFFTGQELLSKNIYYLTLPNGNSFSYYTFLADPHYLYHFDLGYEYVFDANDDNNGIYLYDFASKSFWYTSPVFPFPYLYDFSLNTVLYYYPDPDPSNPGRYDTDGVRYFYRFDTGQIIVK